MHQAEKTEAREGKKVAEEEAKRADEQKTDEEMNKAEHELKEKEVKAERAAAEADEQEDSIGSDEEWERFVVAWNAHRANNPEMTVLQAARAFSRWIFYEHQLPLYERESGDSAMESWREWTQNLIEAYEGRE